MTMIMFLSYVDFEKRKGCPPFAVPEVPAQPTGTTQSSEVDRSKIVALII